MGVVRFKNRNVFTKKSYSEVPAAFELLVDLGDTYDWSHYSIVNYCDQPIVIQFSDNPDADQRETTVAASGAMGSVKVRDGFQHGGIIKYKYLSDPPTGGSFEMESW